MPAYDYQILRGEAVIGSITAILPVAERDAVRLRRAGKRVQLVRAETAEVLGSVTDPGGCVRLKRAELPERLTVAGSAANPETPERQIERGFYREEQRLGADFERYAGMSKKEIRAIHAAQAPVGAEEQA
jgi:hypothetical protein